jgi:hypothetical protein
MHRMTVAIVVTAAAIAGLTACSVPEKHLVDGSGDPFGCLGAALPSMAQNPITIDGSLIDPFIPLAVAGASVEGFLVGTTASIFTVTSDANGEFSRKQGSGGVPRSVFLRASPNGYLPSYFFPAVPVSDHTIAAIQMLTAMELATIASVAETGDLDPAKANLFVSVIDCNGNAVAGATVATTPPGTVRYFANKFPSPTSIATDAITGSAVIANIPISHTTISATVNGMTLRSSAFDGVAGALMQAEIQP